MSIGVRGRASACEARRAHGNDPFAPQQGRRTAHGPQHHRHHRPTPGHGREHHQDRPQHLRPEGRFGRRGAARPARDDRRTGRGQRLARGPGGLLPDRRHPDAPRRVRRPAGRPPGERARPGAADGAGRQPDAGPGRRGTRRGGVRGRPRRAGRGVLAAAARDGGRRRGRAPRPHLACRWWCLRRRSRGWWWRSLRREGSSPGGAWRAPDRVCPCAISGRVSTISSRANDGWRGTASSTASVCSRA